MSTYILSVYSPFSDRVGLPLHNIHSLLLFECLLCRSQVLPYPLLHSLTMSFLVFQLASAFNSKLHTFLHPVLITLPHHMCISSQSTTSNDCCDRLNSNNPPKFFICPSVLYGDTTQPSNHLHLCSFKLKPNIN